MAKIKGCVYSECLAKQKKMHYKKDDSFCTKCGRELSYVCKKCHTVMQEKDKGNLCLRCISDKKDKRDQRTKKAVKVGGGIVAVGMAAVPVAKKVFEIAKETIKTVK